MKYLTLTKLFLAGVVFVMSSPVMATMVGSKHDLSNKGYTGGEICNVCHTPHNADQTVTNAPLWDHEVSAATYIPYSGSPTLDATVGQPAGTSKLCLSCHDGTVAIDSFGGQTGSSFIGGGDLLGTDLANDHPISFVYDTALANADGGLFDPVGTTTSLGSTIDADLLFAQNVECASCHDVHGDNTIKPLLRISNASSALCLTCHDK